MKKTPSSKQLTQEQVDSIIRKFKGPRAVDKLIAASKEYAWQRFLMSDGSVFHVSTKTGKLTITPAKEVKQ